MKKFLVFCLALIFLNRTQAQVTAKDCSLAVNVCTSNSFSVQTAGSGFIDFTTGSTVSNPLPGSASMLPPGGSGCLYSGELNPTWMIINIQTPGTLEFSMGAGTGAGAQSGCYDWIMWVYNASSCTGINANTMAPVRCCWNNNCSGGTGLSSAANLPAGAFADDFGAPLNVNCGDKFIMCFSNYSSVTTLVPLNFFGTAGVSCTPLSSTLAISSASICSGSFATLSVTPSSGTTYTWMPGGQNTSSISVSPASTTIYTLTAKNACGTLTGTTSVIVSSPINLIMTTVNGNCSGAQGSATVAASGGVPAYTYSWSPAGGTGPGTPSLPSGNYSVTVTDALGCKKTATTTILSPIPTTFSVSSTSGSYTLFCNPSVLTLTAVNTSTLTNVTYTWTSPTASGSSYIVTAPGVYTVTAQDIPAGSCIASQTFQVFQNTSAPTITVSPTTRTITCNGAPACFTAVCSPTTNVQGQWFDASATALGGLSNSPILMCTGVPGTYSIVVTNIASGCVVTQTVSVTASTVVPTMTVNSLSGNTITCNQPCLVFNITASAGPAPKTYSWTNVTTSVTTSPATGGYTICTPGNYVAQYQDGNLCRISQTITVMIDTLRPTPLSITDLPSNSYTLSCYNPTLIATGYSNPLMPATNYSWTIPPNLTIATNTISISTVSVTSNPTTFTVLAKGANGCVGRQKVNFYEDLIVPPYSAIFTPSAITCATKSVAMSPNSLSTSTIPVTFTFTSPAPTTTANASGSLFGVPGTYTMNYQNPVNGCIASTQTIVPLNVTPPSTVVLSPVTIPCGATTVGLIAGTTTQPSNYIYTWITHAGVGMSCSSCYSTSVNAPGVYAVVITNTVNGCTTKNLVSVSAGTLTPSFTADPAEGFAPLSVNFINNTSMGAISGTGSITTTWSYGNGTTYSVSNSNSGGTPNGATIYQSAGNYTVLLVVQQSIYTGTTITANCVGTATGVVHVELPSELIIPNIFTPNGDGSNDFFTVQSTSLNNVSCQIFDRWGVKMYDVTSEKGQVSWDGKNLGGKEVPAGTYFYMLKATGKDGSTFDKQGTVSLYR